MTLLCTRQLRRFDGIRQVLPGDPVETCMGEMQEVYSLGGMLVAARCKKCGDSVPAKECAHPDCPRPVQEPLFFGAWDHAYCSRGCEIADSEDRTLARRRGMR
jgi:hypothetical protein